MTVVKLDGYNRVYAIDSVMSEFKALFGKNSSAYMKELKRLRTSLAILDADPVAAVMHNKTRFEHLENTSIYAIRHVSQSNPRVLYATFDDRGNIILLYCFKEKSKSDYNAAISTAEKRFEEVFTHGTDHQ